MLRPRQCRSCFRDRCSQLISACLPTWILNLRYEIRRLAARVGLAPTPNGLTDRRATLTPPGNGAAGRILTCIVPLRRRMPDVFDHGSKQKWSERQDFHLRPPGSRPGALKTELRSDKNGALDGTCTHTLPADNGLLFCSATRAKWWEVLVTLQLVSSSFVL